MRDTKYVFAHTGKTSTAKATVCTQLFFYVFLRQFAPRVYVRIFLEQNAIGKIMPPKWLDLQNRRQQRAVDVASGAQENRGDRAAHIGRDGRPDRRHHSRLFDGRYGNRRYGYCLEEKEKGSRTMKKKLGLGLLLAVLACSV